MTSLNYHLAELDIALDPTRREHFLPQLDSRHRRVLDVGCGVGQTLVASGLASPSEARAGMGVDIDVSALAAGHVRWPGLPLVAARGEALPFVDEAFDLVLSRVALPYMDVAAALRECHRVLRQDGMLWLALHRWHTTRDELLDALRRRAWKAVAFRSYVAANGLLFQAIGRTVPCPGGRGRTESWQGARGLQLALRRAGFADMTVQHLHPTLVMTARKPATGRAAG